MTWANLMINKYRLDECFDEVRLHQQAILTSFIQDCPDEFLAFLVSLDSAGFERIVRDPLDFAHWFRGQLTDHIESWLSDEIAEYYPDDHDD